MSELDVAKEEIAYLKVWLGSVGIFLLHPLVKRQIQSLKEL